MPQATRLNRGWSDAGRRWRALERLCAANDSSFLFVAVSYGDVSDIPSSFEFLVEVPGAPAVVERFENQD